MPTVRRACMFAQLRGPGLGDLVQRNILLALIRRAHPEATVTLMVGRSLAGRFTSLIRGHLYADDLLVCPDPEADDPQRWRGFIDALAGRQFDLCVVDPASVTLTASRARLGAIPRRVGVPRGTTADRDLTHPVVLPPGVLGSPDLYDYACGFARALGLPPPRPAEVVPRLPRRPEPLPQPPTRPCVGVHPGGARHWNRRWPIDRYGRLCARLVGELGASLYLFGDRADRRELRMLAGQVQQVAPGAVARVAAGGPLNRTANLVAELDVLVGNDSGPAHLAAAVGTPTVVLYGPTGTELLWSRIYPRHRGVSRHYLCQRISHEADQVASRRCEYGCPVEYQGPAGPYPRCLTAVEVEDVWAAIIQQLRAYPGRPARRPT